MTTTTTTDAVAFFYDHAGYSYDPVRETAEEGRQRCARDLAAAESAYRADPDMFVVWEVDDIDSDFFGAGESAEDEPHALYQCLLCRDTEGKPDVIRGYDPTDGIFERPGKIVGSLGGIDLGEYPNPDDPYKRVIVAEMYAEFEATRESAIVRGDE